MLSALGRGVVRTTLTARQAVGGQAGVLNKSVGHALVNSVRNSGGVGVYRRVAAPDSRYCVGQVGGGGKHVCMVWHIVSRDSEVYFSLNVKLKCISRHVASYL